MKINTAKMKELRNRMADLRKQMLEESKVIFVEAVTDLFATHEELESFAWRQYTDYYCDGGPCDFTAHIDEDSIAINGGDFYGEDEDQLRLKMAKDVSKVLSAIGDEHLETMFGDHSEIVVRRTGDIEIESYEDHD